MKSQVPEAPHLPVPATAGALLRERLPSLGLCLGAWALLFRSTLLDLGRVWTTDPDFSHGLLVLPACAFLLWRCRAGFSAAPAGRSIPGFLLLAGGIALHSAGRVLMTDFLLRAGAYVSLAGALWAIFGSRAFRAAAGPVLFLAFAIPPPSFLFATLRTWLREWATIVSADVLDALGVQVVQAGNTLTVGDHPLEVADACSGIRSLLVIIAAAVFYAILFRSGPVKGVLVTIAAIPVTMLVNILRIAVLALCLERCGVDLTSGWAHDALSLAVFALSLGFLYLAWRFLDWLLPARRREAAT